MDAIKGTDPRMLWAVGLDFSVVNNTRDIPEICKVLEDDTVQNLGITTETGAVEYCREPIWGRLKLGYPNLQVE